MLNPRQKLVIYSKLYLLLELATDDILRVPHKRSPLNWKQPYLLTGRAVYTDPRIAAGISAKKGSSGNLMGE